MFRLTPSTARKLPNFLLRHSVTITHSSGNIFQKCPHIMAQCHREAKFYREDY
jgi:hypothetical protein